MRRLILCLALLMVVSTIPMAMADDDHNRSHRVRIHLSGFNEVHFSGGPPATLIGAISTPASGKFVAEIDEKGQKIHYKLSYKNLRGAVTQGHIHFGQRHTVGGIVVWLCQGQITTDPPGVPAPAAVAALTPLCPRPEGTVEGTITPDQVLVQAPQGFAEGDDPAGDFDELVRAILAGAAYVNVHSSRFGPGEIRGQFPSSHDD
jgi:hypothetical protein